MAMYKVPQDVEAEDKLLGPFTFRQFIYLLIVAAMGFIAFSFWQITPVLALIPVPIILLFLALALPLRKEQPMEVYLAAIISYYIKPKIRLWDPDGVETRVEVTAPKVIETSLSKDLSQEEAEKRLTYLAQIVDSKGWATRGVGSNVINNSNMINPEVYSESMATVDILDEDYTVGQNIDQRLKQTNNTYKQNVIESFTQQSTTPASAPVTPDNFSPSLTINPYPKSNQATLNPLSVENHIKPSPGPAPLEDNKPSEKPIPADIIELATNAPEDFSIATLASQAKRITKKKELSLGEDEVVISLR